MLLSSNMIVKYLLQRVPFPRTVTRKFWGPNTPRIQIAAMSTTGPPKLDNVAVNTEEGIAIVKYNRPKSGNALNTPTIKVR